MQLFGRRYGSIAKISLVFACFVALVLLSRLFVESDNPAIDVLDRGLVGEPDALHPHDFSSASSRKVLQDVGEGLLAYTPTGDLVGGVAFEWSVSSNGLVHLFRLRENAKWSNGENVTAGDFVYSFRTLASKVRAAGNSSSVLQILHAREILAGEKPPADLGVRAIDDTTLEITLRAPTPYFPQSLTHPSLYPVYRPQRVSNIARYEIYNGAFTVEKRILGSQINLKKNEYYWDSANVGYEEVRYHVIEEGAEFSRYRANELDITDNVAPSSFEKASLEYPEELHVSPILGVYYYGFNLESEVFADNYNLRRALSLAIDREKLVDIVIGRGEKPAHSWIPPGVWNYSPQLDAASNLPKAEREILAQDEYRKAGYGAAKRAMFELRYNTSDVQQRIALAIQSMWRDVLGADVTLVNEEFGVLLTNIREGKVTEMFRLSWIADFNDAENFLQMFHSNDPSNFTRYKNQYYDDLIDQAAQEVDVEARRRLLEEAERTLIEDQPVVPIYFYVCKHLVRGNVKGWASNALDYHPSKYLWSEASTPNTK